MFGRRLLGAAVAGTAAVAAAMAQQHMANAQPREGTTAATTIATRTATTTATRTTDAQTRPTTAAAGKVYLVGAGPGAADLLTLRGRDVIARADVVVHDALIGDDILKHCRADAEVIRKGKRGQDPKSATQEEINELLVAKCQAGLTVARVKGGDPLIFGRAADEMRALHKAGCAWELVPGVSSVFAGPAAAHVLLTHKRWSSAVAIATGHDPDSLDMGALARMDTVVFIMAGATLPVIVEKLQACGRTGATPVAVIKHATLPNQRIWTGTLDTIVDAVAGERLSPSVVVIGDVAQFAANHGLNLL
ncbi:uroporphyrinogen-III C-methyltransferase [Salpingoeca rosetta]|uniref:uroporphyrinogen-III C-methyltransferase n=1 Tax=Salpingoeca rosetta (strain ATCC 50818 / BSB-021) TaxID=946362 RepID=F2U900_SALR5|nr:uroporphyrinogen-III C-methyltransferase [Salpingoeca rosetta]EGD73203.1 uroporphyrinogen-III C-methyltransferase [Salpingoeca rosetta]|eukprot:XP_004994234.1 uroporphyrinogen-III C-methyltransferase [Salpingoeca rosetta]